MRPEIPRLILMAAGLGAGADQLHGGANPGAAEIVFQADYEDGLMRSPGAEGGGRSVAVHFLEGVDYQAPPRGRVEPAPAMPPGRTGSQAAHFTLCPGDPQLHQGHRAELRLNEGETVGDTMWYAFSIFVPADAPLFFPTPGCNVRDESGVIFAQWHHADTENARGLSPVIAVEVHQEEQGGTIGTPHWQIVMREFAELGRVLSLSDRFGPPRQQGGRSYYSRSRPRNNEPGLPVRLGEWTDFVLQIRWSVDGAGGKAGFVRCWIVDAAHPKGRLFEETDFQTYPADITRGPYMKWGLYKYHWKAPPWSGDYPYGHRAECRTEQSVFIDEVTCWRDNADQVTWSAMRPRR